MRYIHTQLQCMEYSIAEPFRNHYVTRTNHFSAYTIKSDVNHSEKFNITLYAIKRRPKEAKGLVLREPVGYHTFNLIPCKSSCASLTKKLYLMLA